MKKTLLIALVCAFAACVAHAGYLFVKTPNHQYLRTTSDPPLQWNSGDFTVSLWFKVADVTQAHTLLRLEHTETNNRYLLIADGAGQDNIKWISQVGGTQYTASTANTFSAGAWHHVLARKSSNFYGSIYVSLDGKASGSDLGVSFPTTDESYTQVSGDSAFIPAATGAIAEVAIWNSLFAGASDDHVALTKGMRPLLIRPQSLIWYAPLIGGLQEVSTSDTLTAYNSPVPANDHSPMRR